MTRALAFGLAVILLAAGVIGAAWHPQMIPAGLLGFLMLAGLMFERYVYKPVGTAQPGLDWERTAERFVDPGTGQTVTVWYHPGRGERRYVAEGEREKSRTD